MNDLSKQLRTAVEHRTRAVDMETTLARIADRTSRRRRRRLVARAGVLVLMLGLGGVALRAGFGDSPPTSGVDVRTDPAPTPPTTPPTTAAPAPPTTAAPVPSTPTAPATFVPTVGEAGVKVYPTSPLEVRGDAAVVWTGAHLVVWGGDVEAFNMGLPGANRVFTDGAVLDPATSEWHLLSDAPLPATSDTPVGLATAHGVLLARGRSAALWHQATDTWTALPDAPGEIHDLVGGGSFAVSASANATLDLDTQSWSPLPDPPLDLQRPSSVWTGSSLIVIGGPDTPFTSAAAISFDPANGEWSVLSEAPDIRAEAVSAAWDGERVVAVNYDMSAVAYDPVVDQWTQLPLVPARFYEWYPSALTTGQTTIGRMAQAVAMLRGDEWLPLPSEALTGGHDWSTVLPVTGSDATFIVWSIDQEAAANRAVAVDLEAVFSASPVIQVGVAGLVVGDGLELVSVSSQRRPAESITVDLAIDGETCSMTSTYGFGGQDTTWEEVTLRNDEVDTPWRVSPDGSVVTTDPTSSDVIEIVCDRPATALDVAGRARFAYHEQRGD